MFNKFTPAIKSVLSVKLATMSLASAALLVGCGSDSESVIEENAPFTLNFSAKSAGETVVCDSTHNNFGTADDGLHSISVSDLRFYVSNVKFYDENNNELNVELDSNDFQLNHEQGFVGLVDLTSNTAGACVDGATERTNESITGTVLNGTVASVSFDVGVPQAVMQDVIATNTQEDAPTPLNEMYWSWASGYRHFVMEFTIESNDVAIVEHVEAAADVAETTEEIHEDSGDDHSGHAHSADANSTTGTGAVHLGSTDCKGADDVFALESQNSCGFVNTPKVTINNFNLATDTVVIDVDAMLLNAKFSADDGESVPTVSCHSFGAAASTDCSALFENFGLSTVDGSADADTNLVFIKE
ncbi:MbnP family copper-binding protein [Colwellia sp. E2M01]|uniref:MbnP family copper-binding protein n=1 Tax=Colwellia sp. E2M01 TaxID=2841561 RepID=UPI001C08A1BC|nr:MbnP family copper-binding protein [Colwellia sp. E2M01]MBU2870691.1 metallo-mystery pair system four-Cys motif protein [Colwellia sp. E2M01]